MAANGPRAYKDQVLVNARDIENWVYYMTGDTFMEGSKMSYKTEDQLEELENLAQKFRRWEDAWLDDNVQANEGFSGYGNGLTRLQTKFNEIKDKGLFNFAANYISNGGSTWAKAHQAKMSYRNVEANIRNILLKGIPDSLENVTDSVLDKARMKLVKALGMTKNVEVKDGGFHQKNGKTNLYALENYFQRLIREDYKFKDSEYVKKAYQVSVSQKDEESYTVLTEVDFDKMITDKGRDFTYYPYYALSPEEKKKLKDLSDPVSLQIWNDFKKSITIVSQVDSNKVEEIMQQLLPEFFMKDDLNNVKGALGELQAGLILAAMFRKKVHMIGHKKFIKNIGGKDYTVEPGIDIVLGGAGFQIKNYSNTWGGYNLKSNTKSFSAFKNEELSGKSTDQQIDTIGKYIALRSFNQPDTSIKLTEDNVQTPSGTFNSTTEYYQNFWKENINMRTESLTTAIYILTALNINKIFPFSEMLQNLVKQQFDGRIGNRVENLFWIFGGETIVRSSSILKLVHDRLFTAWKALMDGAPQKNLGLSVNLLDYNGPRYMVKDYWYKNNNDKWAPLNPRDRRAKAPKLSEIYDTVNINFKLSIRISDILNETNVNDILEY